MDELTLHPLFLRNPEGLTVAQLKGQLAAWPEVDGYGQPLRVWLQQGDGMALACCEMAPLNLDHDGHGDGHLLLLPNAGVANLDEYNGAEI
jgi:hypothetical protein